MTTHLKLNAVDRSTIRQALRMAIASQRHLKESVERQLLPASKELFAALDGDIATYEELLKRMQQAL